MDRTISAVTLSSTAKALYTSADFPALPAFFREAARKMKIHLFGKMTTGATPGNGSFKVFYGSGADNAGTALMTGTAVALLANQTDIPWTAELDIFCVTPGASGSLFCSGIAHFGVSLIASTLQPILLPASTPASVGSLDLTDITLIPSVQYLRSGSTAETMQVLDFDVIGGSSGKWV